MNKIYINPEQKEWQTLLQRPVLDHTALEATVSAILSDVQMRGDAAVLAYTKQFDGVELSNLLVTKAEKAAAPDLVDVDLRKAIELAKTNITKFHTAQKESIIKIETTRGVVCYRKSVAIEKVGLYIPGGTAPLFSTLLMLGIPAVLAGCKEITVCTAPDKNGNVPPIILFVANLIGIDKVYKASGVQAIAAMAFGTETIPATYKIFGPGNQYVTCAKQMVNAMGIAIDMPAGPSELAIFADETCNPGFVAADLLSQAEHGLDSQVVLVTTQASIAEKVQQEIEKQSADLARKEIVIASLTHSRIIVMENPNDAFTLLNEYAPEHLIIASDNAESLAELVINAGSVFLGHYSPESAGDYASGTNHTLPTNGFAKVYSGVSMDSFVKKITFQQLTKQGIQEIGHAVELMAAAEGLEAHKKAITLRLNENQ